eukprot:snap_masked-scaffold_103-processed-gene-0.19-mRNA-1 protein AED:1.00 eAED:1.00 QI:0/0/0/0/1/1/2/0/90
MGIKERYSEIEYYFSKQILVQEKWIIEYVNTKAKDADILIKPVSRKLFLQNVSKWMTNLANEALKQKQKEHGRNEYRMLVVGEYEHKLFA